MRIRKIEEIDEIVKFETIEQTIFKKHPPSEPIDDNCFIPLSIEKTLFHLSILDRIKIHRIKKANMRTNGTQRLSGLDANERKRILNRLGQQSVEISRTKALMPLNWLPKNNIYY